MTDLAAFNLQKWIADHADTSFGKPKDVPIRSRSSSIS